jgi:hypothetical protein
MNRGGTLMVSKKSRSRGRPTRFSPSLSDEICTRLEASGTGLARMLDEAPDLPCSKTVWTWMAAKPDFSQKIAEAKERQLESMQYRGVELIDGVDCAASHASVALAQAKASSEARFKLAAKIAPRKYGSRIDSKDEPEQRLVLVHMDDEDMRA